VIPKSTARKTHYDIVLGVSTQDLNQDTVEAIIVTFNQVADAEISQSEVIWEEIESTSWFPEEIIDSVLLLITAFGVHIGHNFQGTRTAICGRR
jgi:hypothetical protein